jgi:hypothetical protein
MKAPNADIAAQNYDYQARSLRAGENGPLFSGILGAGTQLLGGVSDYIKFQKLASLRLISP